MSALPPKADIAGAWLAPLRAKAEAQNSGDFSLLWAGQAASLARVLPAAELTRKLANEALEVLHDLGQAASAGR